MVKVEAVLKRVLFYRPGDVWALWPCGTMCQADELHEFTHKSDDYELVDVTEYDEHGNPTAWTSIPR